MNQDGLNALSLAFKVYSKLVNPEQIWPDYLAIIKLLIELYDPNISGGVFKKNILMYAIEYHQPNSIILNLIRRGVNINFQDFNQLTPLMHCIMFRQEHLIPLLLQQGANILLENENAETAIDMMKYVQFSEETLALMKLYQDNQIKAGSKVHSP